MDDDPRREQPDHSQDPRTSRSGQAGYPEENPAGQEKPGEEPQRRHGTDPDPDETDRHREG